MASRILLNYINSHYIARYSNYSTFFISQFLASNIGLSMYLAIANEKYLIIRI